MTKFGYPILNTLYLFFQLLTLKIHKSYWPKKHRLTKKVVPELVGDNYNYTQCDGHLCYELPGARP